MNVRDRFNATMRFERCSPPNWEFFGPWGETMTRWISEGLDASRPMEELRRRTGEDAPAEGVPVRLGLWPEFKPELLEDHPEFSRVRGADGIVRKQLKGTSNMPVFEENPVVTRADWERVKERLQPDTPGRLPDNWAHLVEGWKQRERVLILGSYPYGMFGTPRDLLGVQRLLMGFYDEPDLVEDIMATLADLWFGVWSRVLAGVKPGCVQLWEDMSFKNGPLISPAMVRRFMVPHYRRLFGLARDCGVDTAWVDTDGNCHALIGPMMEAGLTGMYPFEVASGMDITEVRRLHPRLQILGGIDKLEVARGKQAIDRELAAKLPLLLASGGYIPSLDHLPHPSIGLEDYVYYRKQVTEYIEESEG